MAQQRDYAARNNGRKKKKSNGNKTVLLLIATLAVVGFTAGLFLLKEKSPEPPQTVVETKTQPKSQLPSRPEEVWSYIKELESRTVPTTEAQQNSVQLSEKQKEELKKLTEKEKQAELDRIKRAEAAAQAGDGNMPTADTAQDTATAQQDAAKAAEEPLKAEAAKPEQTKKPTIVEATSTDKLRAEQAKKEAAAKKAEQSQKTETAAKSAGGKFGLQCGAFKNKAQAENLQARLAMSGFNARVNASADWNRVVIGPVGDRNAANAARQQASSITNCVIIGM